MVFLLAAVAIVPIFRRLQASPVIGYLAAGAVIGPYGFGFVRDIEESHTLAELGIVFLLFTIGMELSLERLKIMARYVFGLGTAQVGLTGLAIGAFALVMGASFPMAAVVGGALALSSTAFVLQLLSERGELSSRLGRVVLAVLLLQDLAVVPGIAIVTALGDPGETLWLVLALAGLKALVALVVILTLGRLALRPLYRVIAATRSPELFAATTLLVVLATASATAAAGLSMALGAFLAGLLLAGTEYRHQIEADIQPFRGILLALFFMSVGMLIDLRLLAENAAEIAVLVIGLVVLKGAIIAALARAFGFPLPLAVNIGLHLAQGGEFAFVLFTLATRNGVIGGDVGQLLFGVVAVSMVATPVLVDMGRRLQLALERRSLADASPLAAEGEALRDHVIITGYGRVGQAIGRLLAAQDIPYLALDMDPDRVKEARLQGLPVFFGDAGRHTVLHAAGVDHARAVVVTLDDPAATARLLEVLRQDHPDLQIFARARDHHHLDRLMRAGATSVVPELAEGSLQLGGAVLKGLGQEPGAVDVLIEHFRDHDYRRLEDVVEGKEADGGRGAR